MSINPSTSNRSEARRLKLRALAAGFAASGAMDAALATGVTVDKNGLLLPLMPLRDVWSADGAVIAGVFVTLDF